MTVTDILTFNHLYREILNRYPSRRQIFLGIGDLVIQVKSNSADLMTELLRYFREFTCRESNEDILIYAVEAGDIALPLAFREKEPDPGKHRIKEEFLDLPDGRIVRKRLTGLCFLFNGRKNLACGPCLANSNQIVNFINNRFIEWMLLKGSLLAHAAAVCLEERGLALAGVSGSGKSSLALRALTLGASFVSNDRLMMAECRGMLRMYGIPKHPRVNPGTLLSMGEMGNVMSDADRRSYSRMNENELWNVEHKHDLIIDEVFGCKRFRLSAPMNGLLLLNWGKSGTPLQIRPIDIARRGDLLQAFIKPPGLFFFPGEGMATLVFTPERYIERLSRCNVFEATGRVDFDGAAAFCLDFLKEGTGR